jgi:hypothetical protein
MNLLYATHPNPSERRTAVGNAREPKMAKLPEGREPPLRVAPSFLPALATVTAGQPRETDNRALSSEQHWPAQQLQSASSPASGPTGGSGMGIDPGGRLRGLIRR